MESQAKTTGHLQDKTKGASSGIISPDSGSRCAHLFVPREMFRKSTHPLFRVTRIANPPQADSYLGGVPNSEHSTAGLKEQAANIPDNSRLQRCIARPLADHLFSGAGSMTSSVGG